MLSGRHQNELYGLCCRTVAWRSKAIFRWEFLKAPAAWEQITTSHLCQRGSFCVWLLHDSCHGPGLPLWAQEWCWGTGRAGRGSSTGHCGVSLEEEGWKSKSDIPLDVKATFICLCDVRREPTYPVWGAFCVGRGAGHTAAAVGWRVTARPPVVF